MCTEREGKFELSEFAKDANRLITESGEKNVKAGLLLLKTPDQTGVSLNGTIGDATDAILQFYNDQGALQYLHDSVHEAIVATSNPLCELVELLRAAHEASSEDREQEKTAVTEREEELVG